MHTFSILFGVDTSINPPKISLVAFPRWHSYFEVDVSIANDVAFDIAKCSLSGKVVQGYLNFSTKENGIYIMKWNDSDILHFYPIFIPL